jgi:hypothetical protein
MVESLWWNAPRINIKKVNTQTSNTGKWSICGIEKLFYVK